MNVALGVTESRFHLGTGDEHVWLTAGEGVGNGSLLEEIEIRFGPKEFLGASHSQPDATV